MTFQNPYSSPETTSARMIDHDRRSLRRCVVVSAISGCIWAVIAYFVGSQWMGAIIVGGLLESIRVGLPKQNHDITKNCSGAGNTGRVRFALQRLFPVR